MPPHEWPAISEIDVDQLLTDIDNLLVEQFDFVRVGPDTGGEHKSSVHVSDVESALGKIVYAGIGGGGNLHDTELGCINALVVKSNTEAAVEETLAGVRCYAATNPLFANFDWGRERRILEGMAYSFVNKFTDYTDRLPPDLYAVWQQRRGEGVLEPRLVYDRLRRLWCYPEAPEGAPKEAPADTPKGDAKRQNGHTPRFQLVPFGYLRPGTDPGYLVDELIPLHGIVLVWGKRKCLKSFLMYDLCFHIARHSEYRERMIQTGPVVYCAFEGAHGYNKRAEALRRYHKVPDSEVSRSIWSPAART